jgi:hypothetical protein
MKDPWNPTPNEIRWWACMPRAVEPCQDWDLALSWSLPEKVLIDLPCDEFCPARRCMLGVLYFIVRDAASPPSPPGGTTSCCPTPGSRRTPRRGGKPRRDRAARDRKPGALSLRGRPFGEGRLRDCGARGLGRRKTYAIRPMTMRRAPLDGGLVAEEFVELPKAQAGLPSVRPRRSPRLTPLPTGGGDSDPSGRRRPGPGVASTSRLGLSLGYDST